MLIFDFDGVLIDSIDEITVTAYNAATGQLVLSLEAMPGHVSKLFRKNRFHVQSIGDAIPLIRALDRDGRLDPDRVLTPGEYHRILAQEKTPLLDRIDRFFLARKAFVEKDEPKWLSLNAPFQPIWNELKGFPDDVVLLTNKDKEATLRLCRRFGYRISEENVYSGDKGRSKVENLNRIHRRFDRAPYEFVDDSLKNLHELDIHFNQNQTGLPFLRPILAGWGYVGPEDEKAAQDFRYSVFSQQDLIDLLHRTQLKSETDKKIRNSKSKDSGR